MDPYNRRAAQFEHVLLKFQAGIDAALEAAQSLEGEDDEKLLAVVAGLWESLAAQLFRLLRGPGGRDAAAAYGLLRELLDGHAIRTQGVSIEQTRECDPFGADEAGPVQ